MITGRVVIIGGGIAGITAAERLLLESECELTIIDAERHALYSRVLLPKLLEGKVAREKIFLKSPEWYANSRINWKPGELVKKIDFEKKLVITANEEFPYEAVIVASGGVPRRCEVGGVFSLQTLDDADALLVEGKKGEVGGEAVVMGGSFIAAEFLNLFKFWGRSITCLVRGEGWWNKILPPEAQSWLKNKLESEGVKVVTGVERHEYLVDDYGKVTGVKTAMGVFRAEIVGEGMGVVPCAEFWPEGEILVDQFLATNKPGIWGAGDAISYFDPVLGKWVRRGTWRMAKHQGDVAAGNLLGASEVAQLSTPKVAAALPVYSIRLLGMPVVFLGEVGGVATERSEVSVLAEGAGVEVRYFIGEELVGVVLIGAVDRRAEYTERLGEKYLI